MRAQADLIAQLTGADLGGELGLGENLTGHLTTGYLPDKTVLFAAPTVIGDPAAGPENEQQLVIYRDTRPIAADELGVQGPFLLRQGAIARRKEGRRFPLNLDWGGGLAHHPPDVDQPLQDTRRLSPFSPGQLPDAHQGVASPELTPTARTVWWTATPQVGWDGY